MNDEENRLRFLLVDIPKEMKTERVKKKKDIARTGT